MAQELRNSQVSFKPSNTRWWWVGSTVKWNEMKTKQKQKNLGLQLLLAVIVVSRTQTSPAPLPQVLASLQVQDIVVLSMRGNRIRSCGGNEQPSYPPVWQQDPQWAWYRKKTDGDKGGKYFKITKFPLEIAFPKALWTRLLLAIF